MNNKSFTIHRSPVHHLTPVTVPEDLLPVLAQAEHITTLCPLFAANRQCNTNITLYHQYHTNIHQYNIPEDFEILHLWCALAPHEDAMQLQPTCKGSSLSDECRSFWPVRVPARCPHWMHCGWVFGALLENAPFLPKVALSHHCEPFLYHSISGDEALCYHSMKLEQPKLPEHL